MLNAKTLRRLIIVTTICAVPVVVFTLKSGVSAIKNKNALFYPDLLKKPDQITQIILQDYKQKLTIQKVGSTWQMVERNNYPALTDKVEELLFSLSDLRIIEPKTSNHDFYQQLDLNDITDENSKALLVTVNDMYNDTVAKFYIGKREGIRIGEEYQEHIFVRKANEDQTWLVQGVVPVSNDFRDWVEQPLIGIVEGDQIKSVTIQRPQASQVVISKNKADEEDFTLANLQPKKGMVLDLDAINTVPFEIAELEFVDVQPAATAQVNWDNSLTATLETFPGVQVILHMVKHNEKVFSKVHAQTIAPVKEDLQQKVQSFNQSRKEWVYELTSENYNALTLSHDNFLKPQELDQ